MDEWEQLGCPGGLGSFAGHLAGLHIAFVDEVINSIFNKEEINKWIQYKNNNRVDYEVYIFGVYNYSFYFCSFWFNKIPSQGDWQDGVDRMVSNCVISSNKTNIIRNIPRRDILRNNSANIVCQMGEKDFMSSIIYRSGRKIRIIERVFRKEVKGFVIKK